MMNRTWPLRLLRRFARFTSHDSGSIVPLFGLSLIPIAFAIGAAVDYSRANSVKAGMQGALDAAVLAGAGDGTAAWQQTALGAFYGNLGSNSFLASNQNAIGTPMFSVTADGTYSGSVSAAVPFAFGVFGMSAMNVTATSMVQGGGDGDSCVLTLDGGAPLSDQSLVLNGAPNVQMTGCIMRSNTSMNCNGHSGNAAVSIAAGMATGCSNPESYARPIPDKFAPLADSIDLQCGGSRPGTTWTAGSVPPNVTKTSNDGYTEYHVCGNLTLSGTGNLTGSLAETDSLIIVENGSLTISSDASISTTRTAIVLSGNNSYSSAISFPSGNGHSASLTLSPPTGDGPWQGIALYGDPNLTNGVDDDWGPGATFRADGVVYLPNSNLTLHGNAGSGNAQCSKIVTRTFSTNGSVLLNFAQTAAGCDAVQMKRWSDTPLHLAS